MLCQGKVFGKGPEDITSALTLDVGRDFPGALQMGWLARVPTSSRERKGVVERTPKPWGRASTGSNPASAPSPVGGLGSLFNLPIPRMAIITILLSYGC